MQKIWRRQAQVSHLLGWKNGTHPFHRHAEEFTHWQTSSPASFWENARKSSKTDREHVIQEELQGKAQYLRDIEMIFAVP